ncbi:PQQ-binding-like beta-propeller repeat protein [Crateriforma conspicua]|uniref:Outer membrane protein assembly factor BamB n=1 Tax=Crateriforma conspicua TaxID=2527996 RepID=A0A5C5YCX7_9PLAN|nr:PQQ-binding-like beta-propeller repeat protein [Crateriforma conspicua]QDV65772.1 Outer membrane protein assembly factor BamB precursor [Crateriforma conspicua]TWT71172.1 Outer membrane protein assembly factor BamB precursor [Crateriforma conspicua]
MPDDPQTSAVPVDTASQPPVHSLRWWPAAALLLLMAALRYGLGSTESPSLSMMMLAFMGPAAVCLLILLWWCFGSAATIREKAIGLIGLVVIAVISVALMHPSLQGMATVIMVIPTAIALFAVALILFSRQPKWRLPVALVAATIGFGFWNLKQSEGVTGQFESQLLWRWQPTAEQSYLKELASRETTEPVDAGDMIALADAQWPAFRGADRNGVVRGAALMEDWDTTPPKLVWKHRIGPAWSSFAVAGNRIYTQEQRGDEEAVLCLDADTGRSIWTHAYPSRFWEAIGGAGPRATPTYADEGLFALGADGILMALDPTDGTLRWERDLKDDARRDPPQWGFSSSPLVVDGKVIVHAGGEDDLGLLAYEAIDGSIAWSVPSGDHSYSSAQLAEFFGTAGILMMTNQALQFVSIADGSTIWQHDWPVENYRAIQPLVVSDTVLIGTSLGEGTRKIQVLRNESDNQWSTVERWTSLDLKPDYNDYVVADGFLYGFDRNIFACIDLKSGQRQWKRGRYGNGQVLLLADADQLLVSSEKGEVVLLRANPEQLQETTRFQALDGKTWNHPVLVGDRLYIRNAQEAACYQMPLKKNETPEQDLAAK